MLLIWVVQLFSKDISIKVSRKQNHERLFKFLLSINQQKFQTTFISQLSPLFAILLANQLNSSSYITMKDKQSSSHKIKKIKINQLTPWEIPTDINEIGPIMQITPQAKHTKQQIKEIIIAHSKEEKIKQKNIQSKNVQKIKEIKIIQKAQSAKIIRKHEEKPATKIMTPIKQTVKIQQKILMARQGPKIYERISEGPKIEHKRMQKLNIIVKPIPKSELTMQIIEDLMNQPPKINTDKPIIKHVDKTAHKESQSSHKYSIRNFKQELEEIDPLVFINRKKSFDLLHHPNQSNLNYSTAKKKLSQYEEQIIKKCALKNMQIYQQQTKHAAKRQQPKQKRPTPKLQQKKHILDRILTRLE